MRIRAPGVSQLIRVVARMNDQAKAAADLIRAATALVVTAGAGMGVDSGLPDFRGDEGFWVAYPPFKKLGLSFMDLANPRWFKEDPRLAWGFYGHRLNLYRSTAPHAGFGILRGWAEMAPCGGFVFTSNVDGQFQAAGFSERHVYECHGSIHSLQCMRGCGHGLFSARGFVVNVDAETCRAQDPLPTCPSCDALARPNVLMFEDLEWDLSRAREQRSRFHGWLDERTGSGDRLVVIECGAGTAIPSARLEGESLVRSHGARMIRINPREASVPAGEIGMAESALAGLVAIQSTLAT